jgi:hypothetical protein
MALKQLIYVLLFLLSSSSCTGTGGANLPTDKVFKKTLKMSVNGVGGVGTMVVPPASKYEIDIEFDARAELVKLRTCHREVTEEKEGFWKRKEHKFLLQPTSPMETSGFCPIEIGVFDLDGANSWGLVEIANESLPAKVYCNGETKTYRGVSLCQSMVGLIQRVKFNSHVSYTGAVDCPKLDNRGDNVFEYVMGAEMCVYVFYDHVLKQYHRHTATGYDYVLLRKIEVENQFPSDSFGGE